MDRTAERRIEERLSNMFANGRGGAPSDTRGLQTSGSFLEDDAGRPASPYAGLFEADGTLVVPDTDGTAATCARREEDGDADVDADVDGDRIWRMPNGKATLQGAEVHDGVQVTNAVQCDNAGARKSNSASSKDNESKNDAQGGGDAQHESDDDDGYSPSDSASSDSSASAGEDASASESCDATSRSEGDNSNDSEDVQSATRRASEFRARVKDNELYRARMTLQAHRDGGKTGAPGAGMSSQDLSRPRKA